MAKKTVRGKTAKVDVEKESLAKELKSLIPKLDSQGLAFLVEQARVHLYNMQVDELNEAAIAANAASAKSRTVASRQKGSGVIKPARQGFKIVGSESGSSFYLYCPNDEVMFSRSEMTQLVKIANGKGSDLEIRERLYNWFDRERRDVFAAIPMANKIDNNLKTLAALIRKSFAMQGS